MKKLWPSEYVAGMAMVGLGASLVSNHSGMLLGVGIFLLAAPVVLLLGAILRELRS